MKISRRIIRRAPRGVSLAAAAAMVGAGLAAVLVLGSPTPASADTVGPPSGCTSGMNAIQCENLQPGAPTASSPMSINYQNVGDTTIQGFATAMSVNAGQTVSFKVNAPSVSAWHVNIFRMGWYQGLGARQWASNIQPSVSLPQTQPACQVNPGGTVTGLVDCGNWAVSASWQVPSYAVSGLYVALLVRNDTGGASEVPFVVRNDGSTSAVVYQTSDATWQAYNAYNPPGVSNPQGSGIDQGNSLYQCYIGCPSGKPGGYATTPATAVSYNRPLQDAGIDSGRDGPFYAEIPMIRFLEENGYDVSYISEVDTDSNSSALSGHHVYVADGHDEYWSANMRANVLAARNSGVNLAFFTGNEDFWKTDYATSPIDGSAERTLVSFKETHNEPPYGTAANQYDPQDPPTWTGTWRDPAGAASGGDSPENTLTGQEFMVNSSGQNDNIQVPYQYAKLQLWRNTAVAKETSSSSPVVLGANLGSLSGDPPGSGTLGYEWDIDADNGFRPAGEIDMSSTTDAKTSSFNQDYGINPTDSSTSPATETHHLTLYRAGGGGGLVFGAGTVQWSWGLDNTNPLQNGSGAADRTMQQFTVNLLADMGAQPSTLLSGLTQAAAPASASPPVSGISSPSAGATIADGTPTTVSGTATDSAGAQVAGVEVSVDGGHTWHPATSMSAPGPSVTWSYSWVAAHGAPTATIESRASDDNGTTESPTDATAVTITCPCSILGGGYAPRNADSGSAQPINVGVKFRSDTFGVISSIRFYKSAKNTATSGNPHVGELWTTSGQLLASAAFSGETASGWQTVTLPTPVPINPGTTYVASYFAPNGHNAEDDGALEPDPLPSGAPSSADAAPLHAVRSTAGNPNGVEDLGDSSPAFPTTGDINPGGDDFGVDVLFTPQPAPGRVTSVTAAAGYGSAQLSWSAPSSGGPVTTYIVTPYLDGTAQAPIQVTGNPAPTQTTIVSLTNGSTYTFTVTASNPAGTAAASPASAAVTPSTTSPPVYVQSASNHASGVAASVGISTTMPSPVGGENRLVVEVGTFAGGGSHATSVTDSAGDGFVELTHSTAPDGTELSFWTAVVTNGGGTRPTVTAKASAASDLGVIAAEYQGLSTAGGTTVLDTSASGSGTTSGAATVQSGATPQTSGTNELAVGGYVDSGFGDTLAAAGGYSARANVSPTGDIESLLEDQVLAAKATPSASASTGASTQWVMSTLVLKSQAMTPPSVPAAPTGVSATAGNGSASVAWTVPANGGAPISSWTVTPYAGSSPQPAVTVGNSPATTTANIPGLTPGTAYTFQVTATNSVGTGPASAASNSVIPTALAPPGAPGAVSATASPGAATVTWNPPGSTGGSPITSYTVTPYEGGSEGSSAQTPIVVSGNGGAPPTSLQVTGLTNGVSYVFAVAATNAIGTGTQSAQSNAVVPATVPGAPTAVTASAGNGAATVTWSAPANGGSALTSYTVVPYLGSAAQTGLQVVVNAPATSANVTGLINGDSYTFTVTAANAIGSSPASTPSAAVTPTAPPTPPTAPTGVTATAGTGSVTVAWSAPSGGAPPTSYTVTPYAGGAAQAATTVSGSPPATSAVLTSLTNGTTYTFTVTASNTAGSSPASAPSAPATPSAAAPQCPCSLFGATAAPNPDSGDGSSVNLGVAFTVDRAGYVDGVRFYKSSANTGTHIGSLWTAGGTLLAQATFTAETASGWQAVMFSSAVAVSPGATYVASYLAPAGHYAATGGAFTSAGTASPPLYAVANTSIPNGVYLYGSSSAFPVNSYNATNYWVDAVFSQAPLTPPGAPTGVSATPGNGAATVTWSAPASSGGAPITSYSVTAWSGATSAAVVTVSGAPPATSATVGGLSNGQAYTFTVSATSSQGTGPSSSPSSAVTPTAPATSPAAPTAVVATAGAASVSVAWSAPAGGASSYTVTPFAGATALASTTVTGNPAPTTATVGGLTNATTYTFTVTAANSAGTGPSSQPSDPATPTASAPACPCTVFATTTPAVVDSGDTAGLTVGLAFNPDRPGYVTGVRFYKATTNTGSHVGTLWTASGSALAQVTFSGETAAGWQTASFATPVAVNAGVTYVVSYFAPAGHYSYTGGAFASAGVDSAPLHALSSGAAGPSGNGLFAYGSAPAFPASSYNATNYWVDPVFTLTAASPPAAPTQVTATAGSGSVTVGWTAPGGPAPTSYTVTPYAGGAAQASTTVSGSPPATTATLGGLTNGTTYTFTVAAANTSGAGPASASSDPATPEATAPTCPCTLLGGQVPPTVDAGDANAVNLGVRFTVDRPGSVTGVRFYKAAANTGTHIGSLWSDTGTLLAQATFSNETASGWQQVTFASPVNVVPGTTYVASYLAPAGHYSVTSNGLASPLSSPPLYAVASGVEADGVYAYGTGAAFPTSSYNACDYWVDVAFTPSG